MVAPNPAGRGWLAAGGSARELDRSPGFELVRVLTVAGAHVRQPHPQAAVLLLPDVAELVADQVVGDLGQRVLDEDLLARLVAAEAPEPRCAEEPRDVPDPRARRAHGPRVEVQPVQPRLGARERRPLLGAAPGGHG